MREKQSLVFTFRFLWQTLTSSTSRETELCSFSEFWDGFSVRGRKWEKKVSYVSSFVFRFCTNITLTHWYKAYKYIAFEHGAKQESIDGHTILMEESSEGKLQVWGQARRKSSNTQSEKMQSCGNTLRHKSHIRLPTVSLLLVSLHLWLPYCLNNVKTPQIKYI